MWGVWENIKKENVKKLNKFYTKSAEILFFQNNNQDFSYCQYIFLDLIVIKRIIEKKLGTY